MCNSIHFTLGTGWGEWLVSLFGRFAPKKEPPYLFTGRLSGLQGWSRCYRKEKDLFPQLELEY